MTNESRLLSLAAVQQDLSLTAHAVRELIRSGELPVLRILDEWRVESDAVERLIRSARRHGTPDLTVLDLPPENDAAAARPVAEPDRWPTDDRPSAQRERRLTDQQRRVLLLVGEGLPNDEIARRLSVEVSTVKSHVSRLLRRLDLPDRGRLIAYAWRHGMLRP